MSIPEKGWNEEDTVFPMDALGDLEEIGSLEAKTRILSALIKLANRLDHKGEYEISSEVDDVMRSLAISDKYFEREEIGSEQIDAEPASEVSVYEEQIRQALVGGSARQHRPMPKEVADLLVSKIIDRRPNDPINYAHLVGRNWAISQSRKEQSAARIQKREEKASAQLRIDERTLIQARKDLEGATGIKEEHKQVLILRLSGLSPTDIRAMLGISQDLEYKRASRGLVALQKTGNLTPALKEVGSWPLSKLRSVSRGMNDKESYKDPVL